MSDIAALLHRWDEAMSSGDAATAAGLSPDDVAYRDHRALGWEGIDGRAALQAWYQSMFDGVEELRVRTELLEAQGDTVLLRQTGSFRARAEEGGGEGELVMATLVTMRDSLFARIEMFEDVDAARAARDAG